MYDAGIFIHNLIISTCTFGAKGITTICEKIVFKFVELSNLFLDQITLYGILSK